MNSVLLPTVHLRISCVIAAALTLVFPALDSVVGQSLDEFSFSGGMTNVVAMDCGGSNRVVFLPVVHMEDVAAQGLSAEESAFIFAWYGDALRLSVLLDALTVSSNKLSTMRFGRKCSAFTSDDSSCEWTLLHVAVLRNAEEVVRLLVARGHPVDVSSPSCRTPLELLLTRNRIAYQTRWGSEADIIRMAMLLLKNGAKTQSPLAFISGVAHGDVSLVEAMVKAGADVNKCGNSGCPPLHLALEMKNKAVARALLRHGADPSSTNSVFGGTALDVADGDIELREMLIKAGARDKTSQTKR